jgi:hypothetical protein
MMVKRTTSREPGAGRVIGKINGAAGVASTKNDSRDIVSIA